jgi:hypothetical protein
MAPIIEVNEEFLKFLNKDSYIRRNDLEADLLKSCMPENISQKV